MTTSEGFAAPTEEQRAYAGNVGVLSERLAAAGTEAGNARLSDNAFGQLCSFFAAPVRSLAQSGVDVASAAQHAIAELARDVGTIADSYSGIDTAQAERFGREESP